MSLLHSIFFVLECWHSDRGFLPVEPTARFRSSKRNDQDADELLAVGGSCKAANVDDLTVRRSKKILKRRDILRRIDEDANAVAHEFDACP
jgi:hypothetical protein